jgi:LysM repeat protein
MAEKEKKVKTGSKQEIDYPLILLSFLMVVVGVLIFIGYDYLKDDAPGTTAIIADASGDASSDEGLPPASKEKVAPSVEKSSAKAEIKNVAKKPESPVRENKPAVVPKEKEKTTPTAKTESVPSGGKTITHTVKAGETFNSIARRYNLSNAALKSLNPQIKDEAKDLKSNVTQLKIRVKAVHMVGPGDILSKVATKYGVSKSLIMSANGKSRDYAARGENLIIPFH